MSDTGRTFDVVLWGATGFTGQLVAEYFASTVVPRRPSVRWALAGRNPKKLQSVKDSVIQLLPSAFKACGPGILIGDSTDQFSVDQIVKQTFVMCCTAGPFQKYGTAIVDACVRFQTHYVDITGETPWVKSIIDKYHLLAEQRGVSIVNCCGYDSIPADIGTFFLSKHFKKGTLRKVQAYYAMKGQFSGGTLASGIVMSENPELSEMVKNPFLLGGQEMIKVERDEDRDVDKASYNTEVQSWVGPFGMSFVNTRIVRRSASLFEQSNCGYGTNFSYNEIMAVPNEKAARNLTRKTPPPKVMKMLMKAGKIPKPGEGPSAAVRAKSWFKLTLIGENHNEEKIIATVSGGDPGYTETAKMVAESALCLAFDNVDRLRKGGVLTPAVACGDALLQRLVNAGIRFKIKDDGAGVVSSRARL